MTPFSLLVEGALKATMVVAAATVVIALLLRNASASLRHLVWGCSLVVLFALPTLSLVLPEWHLAIIGQPSGHSSIGVSHTVAANSLIPLRSLAAGAVFDWTVALVLLWLCGVAIYGLSIARGVATLNRLARETRELTDARWLALADELSVRLQLRSPVRLIVSGSATMPATWGFFRPTVLLSADAERWDPHLRRAVLLHELAHIQRRDFLMQLVAQLCCAIYWFHPAVWYAAQRLRAERELACDEEVLQLGVDACDYAGYLLQIAARLHPPAQVAAAIALARPSQLEGRVTAILSDTFATRLRSTGGTRAAGLAAVIVLALPLAAMRPWKAAAFRENVRITSVSALQSGSRPLVAVTAPPRRRIQGPIVRAVQAPRPTYNPNPNPGYNRNPDPGYDPNPNPIYDPNPDSGYDPNPGAGHSFNPDPRYDPNPNPDPRYDPNPDPRYDPNPNPDRGTDYNTSQNPK